MTLAEFKNFVQRFAPLFRNRAVLQPIDVDFEKTNPLEFPVQGDVAIVTNTLESYEGQKNAAKFVLFYEAGQWRIFSIEIDSPHPTMEVQ